jgi:hypothetical protein
VNKYRYKGSAERVFPYARPAVVVGPGDVIERPDNPDTHWFELVPPPVPEQKPTPSPRAEKEKS